MSDKVTVVPYDAAWPHSFALLAGRLRDATGDGAVRIDHIGSTAVPGLSAKPVVDIQVSVVSLEPRDTYQRAIESCGFVLRTHNPDKTKRYFRETSGGRRTHIHVRSAGSWSEQFSLLFRDFLRLHRADAMDYERGKITLAQKYENDRKAYTVHKAPLIWAIMMRADHWSQDTGWRPGPSDG
jgi:GrpB-like predicted nucleotidyltransferase (UPF0157 family)